MEDLFRMVQEPLRARTSCQQSIDFLMASVKLCAAVML